MTNTNNILTNTCCTSLQLQNYLQNKLTATEARIVEEHFTACALCSDALDALGSLSSLEQHQLLNNSNPFDTINKPVVKLIHRRKRILQIASGLLLLLGLGFGAKLLMKQPNEKNIAAVTKQPEQATEQTTEKIVEDSPALPILPENKTTIIQNKPVTANTPATIKAISTNTTKDNCPPDAAELDRIAKYKETKNIQPIVQQNKSIPIESKVTEQDGIYAKDEVEKPIEITEAKKVLVMPAAKSIAKKESTKYSNDDVSTGQMTTQSVSNTTYVIDGIVKDKNQQTISEQIISAYQQKKYAKTIADGNAYLATKNPAFANTIKYYVGMSYAATNDKNNAIKLLSDIDKKSEFYKLAEKKLAELQ